MLPLDELDALKHAVVDAIDRPRTLLPTLGAIREEAGETIYLTPASALLSHVIVVLDGGALKDLELISQAPSDTPTLGDLVSRWGPARVARRRPGMPETRTIIPALGDRTNVFMLISVDLEEATTDDPSARITRVSFSVSR